VLKPAVHIPGVIILRLTTEGDTAFVGATAQAARPSGLADSGVLAVSGAVAGNGVVAVSGVLPGWGGGATGAVGVGVEAGGAVGAGGGGDGVVVVAVFDGEAGTPITVAAAGPRLLTLSELSADIFLFLPF